MLLRTSLIVRGLDAGSATRPLSYTFSILGLGSAALGGLRGCHAVGILLGSSSIARVRVDRCGTLTVAANGFTTRVLDAVSRK